jgi:hypothetical protein
MKTIRRCTLLANSMLLSVSVIAFMVLGGCSSPPPKPNAPKGEEVKANVSDDAVSDLLEIVKASRPHRYRAERAASVHDVLERWARVSKLKVDWQGGAAQEAEKQSTTGEIDELDVRAALSALAQQFRGQPARFVVEFGVSRTLVVSVVDREAGGCIEVRPGATALGTYCLKPEVVVPTYVLQIGRETLRTAMQRWASQAGVVLRWQVLRDWPLTLESQKGYAGDLTSALKALVADLSAEGVHLGYAVTEHTLTITEVTLQVPSKAGFELKGDGR